MSQIEMPCCKQSEQLVLGSMINSINSINEACSILVESDFYFLSHRKIFLASYQLMQEDSPCDVHLLSEKLKEKNELDGVGGVRALIDLSQNAGTSVHVEEYCTIIKNKSLLRKIIYSCQTGIQKSCTLPDPEAVLEELQKNLFNVIANKKHEFSTLEKIATGRDLDPPKTYLEKVQMFQEQRLRGEIVLPGIPSAWTELDEKIGGLIDSHFVVIGARPSVGKTTFSLNIILSMIKRDLPVGMFSLEMPAQDIVEKLVCLEAGLSHDLIRKGIISSEDYSHFLVPAYHKLLAKPFFIEDEGGLSISKLSARAKRMKESFGIKALVIDYLGQIRGDKAENKQVEIANISVQLKALAKNLSIPVICLVQLNRKTEVDNRAPIMSDLRDSGQIEADADEILLLHRPMDKPGALEIHIAKNRYGSIGKLEGAFEKNTGRIQIISEQQKKQEQQRAILDIREINDRNFEKFTPNF